VDLFYGGVFLAGSVAVQWYLEDSSYEPNKCQLTDDLAAHNDLVKKLEKAGYPSGADLGFVPTGVFIQSLEFKDANDVHLTGYVWQRYDNMDAKEPPGIVFTEAVDSANGIIPGNENNAYRKIIGNKVLVGWYFEVTLRQNFGYKKFPLDHKTVCEKERGHILNFKYLVPDIINSTL
jgi:hypothetical protein